MARMTRGGGDGCPQPPSPLVGFTTAFLRQDLRKRSRIPAPPSHAAPKKPPDTGTPSSHRGLHAARWRGFLIGLSSPLGRLIGAGKHSPPVPQSPSHACPVTCRHEEDAGTKDDVVSGFVELAGCNAESTHEKQNHTQDRKNTRGSNSPCGGERERDRDNSARVRERKRGCGGSMGQRGTGGRECV